MSKQQSIIRKLVFRLVRKHIAGSTTRSALDVIGRYNQKGIKTTVTLLNDHVDSMVKAKYNTNAYVHMAKQIARLHLNSNISVRFSQLGYNISKKQAIDNMENLLGVTEANSICTWIESEARGDELIATEEYNTLKRSYPGIGVELPASHKMDYGLLSGFIKRNDKVKLTSYPYTYPYVHSERNSELLKEKVRYVQMLTKLRADLLIAAHEHKNVMRLVTMLKPMHINHQLNFELPLCYSFAKLNILMKGKIKPVVYTPYGTDWIPYAINGLAEGRLRSLAIAVLNGKKV